MRLEAGPDDRGTRLDVFLARAIPGSTRSHVQVLNRRGAIRVDGRREKSGYRLRGGERVDVSRPKAETDGMEPEAVALDVRYEDEHLAVIEKPAGMVVHPGAGNRSGTLVQALMTRFPELSDAGGLERPGIVHRLDKGTSGLLIVAKTNLAHHRLSASFEQRRVRKTYLAMVHGRPRSDTGRVELEIGRHPTIRTRMSVRSKKGRVARSEYRVLESASGFSLVEVRIHTGRTHQIRVHMSALGCPVVGDATYGQKAHRDLVQRYGALERLCLHAAGLEFPHPVRDGILRCESPLPRELEEIWNRLARSHASGRIETEGERAIASPNTGWREEESPNSAG